MRQFRYFLCLVALPVLLSQCKPTGVVTADYGDKKKNQKEIETYLDTFRADWTWMRMKSSIDMESPMFSGKVKALVTMQKDSILWMRLSKAAIEAARIKITPDSIWIVDKINKQYLAQDFEYFQERFSVFLSFEDLQSMVLGHPVVPKSAIDRFGIDKRHYRCEYYEDDFRFELILDRSHLYPRVQEVDHPRLGYLRWENEEYLFGESQPAISTQRQINARKSDGMEVSLGMSQSQVSWGERGPTRLMIPSHYTPMEF